MSQLDDMKMRMKVHHVRTSERKYGIDWQGPRRDILYYALQPDWTFIIQNGDLRLSNVTAEEMLSLMPYIGNCNAEPILSAE